MAPHKEDSEETPPAETSQQPGDRLQKEQQKELATLDQQDVPDSEMDEKRQAALMTSLEQGEIKAAIGARKCAVSAAAVQKLQDLLLLPAAEAEAALQQAQGDHLKATQLLLEQEL
ncbi:hypothetical protein, conserved [Eimeria maxima]|uniref:Nascent polypeptide-associated complex subunit alpha-like UBA domain-containing protein n=1 Tax=Eimeria maxima TaxID=5804 RepID=U6M327_EIMMA|nr:hypothetical protein, conserved [Eimeria maxima]CDJ58431.1 hypothetical protein, conserved [Eimeria maxima]